MIKENRMTGLQIEIEKRRLGKSPSGEKFSITNIHKLLGIAYTTTQRKLENNTFTTNESLAIFFSLIEPNQRTLEMYVYLFTEQD